MASPARVRLLPELDFETYLDIEKSASNKHEFLGGVVYLMAGGSTNHAAIAIDAALAFRRQLESSPCLVLGSDLKIVTPRNHAAFYPDLSIHCNQALDGKAHFARSPILILEVSSPSTRSFDLTDKRLEYFRIPTLRHYLVLDSESVSASLWSRLDGQTWPAEPQCFDDPRNIIKLEALSAKIKLRDFYRQTTLLP